MAAERPLAANWMQRRRENVMWGLKEQTALVRGVQGEWFPQGRAMHLV